jgi:hypothetical protein
MTSYLRSWLYTGTSAVSKNDPREVPAIREISPQPSDSGEDTERENDTPPIFPALSSAQRAAASETPRILTDSDKMPPPPLPSLASRQPGVPSSSPSSLTIPPSTTKRPRNPSPKREKVALAPGHSALDWADLKTSGKDLRASTACVNVR